MASLEAKYLGAQQHGSFGHVWAAPMQPGMPGMQGMQSQVVYQARTRLKHKEFVDSHLLKSYNQEYGLEKDVRRRLRYLRSPALGLP